MLENVGRYKILSQLGKGAMGIVYLADDPVLNRQVAVKTIDLSIQDAERREFLGGRLLRDARAAASLSHPNIVSVYDVVKEGDIAGIIMEFIAGENLAAYLSRTPVADTRFTLQVLRAMAGALDYTHSRGIIHRDIKPANVMLDASQTPKITDFGIARITEGVTTTMTGTVMGTIEYMAPEQIKGEPVDGRADQFALGVVTYRMLTGRTLFGDQSMATLAYKIVNESPSPVCSHNSWLPPGMDSVLAKALAKDPKDRYVNCAAFADAFAAALTSGDRDAPTVAMPAPPTAAVGSRAKFPILALGVFAVLGAVAVALWKPWTPTPPAAVPLPAAAKATAATPTPTPTPTEPASKGPPAFKSAPKLLVKTAVKQSPEKAAEKADNTAGKVEKKAAAVEPEPPKEVAPVAPVSAEDSFNRGRDLMQAKDYNGAIQAFSRAADLRPNWAQAYHGRGNAYAALEQFDAALRDYSHAIRLNPAVFNFFLSRATCYIRLQQDDAALMDLNQALAIKADAPLVLILRGGIFMRRKEFRKALADFDASIRLQPDNIAAYRGRANARRALGDRPGAQSDVEKANELQAKKGGG